MDKIILICASGRSGSTTMQRILNTIPNSNICGENFGAINSLLEFYSRLKHSTANNVPGRLNPIKYETIISKKIKPSWYNSYNLIEVTNQIRSMITNMFKLNENNNVWGFKEIRYSNGSIKYIKEFKELFPQTKVIIQIRENIANQSNSGWFKNNKNSIQFLTQMNKELIEFYNNNTDFCYFTTFERMFDVNNLKKIFIFIDCEADYNEDKIREILNNNLKD
uniref:Sulfotransferase domain-containing protein n=1 Tax=viral metagenome TaxID=1070528 RepID=A0A6C0ERB3_9ZZZZ